MDMTRLDAGVLSEARETPPMMKSSEPSKPKREGRGVVGVGELRAGNTFESFDLAVAPKMAEAHRRCRDVANGGPWCVFLWSTTPGNGKTHLAIAAAHLWNDRAWKLMEECTACDAAGFVVIRPGGFRERRETVPCKCNIGNALFYKVPELLSFLRRQVGNEQGKGGPDQIVEQYRSLSGLMVFDDLGTEKSTDWAAEQMYRILDGRYEGRLPTIITSNAPVDQIDRRIWSRYREGKVVCEGDDMRGRMP